MTKLQTATEPSMEDILASIRKMISEEQVVPRPVPDQMARTPFAASPPEAPAEIPAEEEEEEEEVEPDPPAPVERPEPSFSSLSHALKAAKPSEQRRTLEEKIADMLESRLQNGDDSNSEAPSVPLAVFGPKKPSPADLPEAERASAPAPGLGERALDLKPDSAAAPQGATKSPETGPALPPRNVAPRPYMPPMAEARGMRPSISEPKSPDPKSKEAKIADSRATEPKNSDAKDVDPKTVESKSAEFKPAESKIGESKSAEAKALNPKQTEEQRIISMPTRLTAAQATGQTGPSPNGSVVNGAGVSALAVRPMPGPAQGARLGAPPREATSKLSTEPEKADARPAAVGNDKPKEQRAEAPPAPRAEKGAAAATPAAATESGYASHAAKPVAGERSAPQPPPATGAKPVAGEGQPSPPSAEKASARPPLSGGPSEELIDAVVELVHKQPHSLSVFTSGSDFIHGVGEHDAAADEPGAASELDHSAAELLRPMLRQWLAQNMPRIVEEALRCELQSSQAAGEDSDKA